MLVHFLDCTFLRYLRYFYHLCRLCCLCHLCRQILDSCLMMPPVSFMQVVLFVLHISTLILCEAFLCHLCHSRKHILNLCLYVFCAVCAVCAHTCVEIMPAHFMCRHRKWPHGNRLLTAFLSRHQQVCRHIFSTAPFCVVCSVSAIKCCL